MLSLLNESLTSKVSSLVDYKSLAISTADRSTLNQQLQMDHYHQMNHSHNFSRIYADNGSSSLRLSSSNDAATVNKLFNEELHYRTMASSRSSNLNGFCQPARKYSTSEQNAEYGVDLTRTRPTRDDLIRMSSAGDANSFIYPSRELVRPCSYFGSSNRLKRPLVEFERRDQKRNSGLSENDFGKRVVLSSLCCCLLLSI